MKLRHALIVLALATAAVTVPVTAEPAESPVSTVNVLDVLTNLWSSLVDLLVEEPVDTDAQPPAADPMAPADAPPNPDDDGSGGGQELGGVAEPGG